jgi:hypothetical protein
MTNVETLSSRVDGLVTCIILDIAIFETINELHIGTVI